METIVKSTLAIEGGSPVRATPFPKRTPFDEREVELVAAAIRSQNLFGLGGERVEAFQEGFARLYGMRHAVASTSGTAAIHVAVGTVDPEPGDEIITAPITDLGTVVPILYQTAIPIFADIDATYNMDPADVERKITSHTRAIIAVHLFGNPCDMDALTAVARRHNVPLIEDCSQAHRARYKGRYAGTMGDISCFSLQQSKHMTTGDGGMTLTNRDDWAERMRLFADKGWSRQPGWGARTYLFLAPNYRMTELQGAVGLAQLDKVENVVARRHALGTLLSEKIAGLDGIAGAPVTPGGEHTYWLYPLRVTGWPMQRFAEALTAEGVSASAGYIGKPIFLCAEALASKRTFGASQFPFSALPADRRVEYTEATCPRAQEALDHLVTLSLNENYTEADMADMAMAIEKVATLLPRHE